MEDTRPPQVAHIERQCHLILYLSSCNLICNIVTIVVAVLIAA